MEVEDGKFEMLNDRMESIETRTDAVEPKLDLVEEAVGTLKESLLDTQRFLASLGIIVTCNNAYDKLEGKDIDLFSDVNIDALRDRLTHEAHALIGKISMSPSPLLEARRYRNEVVDTLKPVNVDPSEFPKH